MTRKKVLIIEDHDDSRELMKIVFREWYETEGCAYGRSALKAIRKSQPDLVVLDVELPDMDGFAVVGEIRSDPALHQLPVIAITAHTMSGDREKHLAAGFDEHIAKPLFDFEEVHRIIERTLARRQDV